MNRISFFPDENRNRKMVMVYINGDFEKGKGYYYYLFIIIFFLIIINNLIYLI